MKKNYFILVLFFIANCYCGWDTAKRDAILSVANKLDQQTIVIEKFAREKKELDVERNKLESRRNRMLAAIALCSGSLAIYRTFKDEHPAARAILGSAAVPVCLLSGVIIAEGLQPIKK